MPREITHASEPAARCQSSNPPPGPELPEPPDPEPLDPESPEPGPLDPEEPPLSSPISGAVVVLVGAAVVVVGAAVVLVAAVVSSRWAPPPCALTRRSSTRLACGGASWRPGSNGEADRPIESPAIALVSKPIPAATTMPSTARAAIEIM
jgi:hypothetical protein